MLLRRNLLYAVIPVSSLRQLTLQRNHRQRLVALEARTYIRTVAATQAVHNVHLHTELHALHGSRSLHVDHREVSTSLLRIVQYERTDRCVRTNVSTLVTLDTVRTVPYRNKGSHTTLLILRSALIPSTILDALERRNLQQVTILCIDRTNYLVDESRVVVSRLLVSRQICPSGIHC